MTSIDPINTPDKLRAARKRLGLTQTELGAVPELSIGERHIRKLESGEAPIPARVAAVVTRLLAERSGSSDQGD